MPPTLGFLPHVLSSEDEFVPFARPSLDTIHSFVAGTSCQPAGVQYVPPNQAPGAQGSGLAASGSGITFEVCPAAGAAGTKLGGSGSLLSRCRLRIFRNGNLGRPCDWAVLVSDRDCSVLRFLDDLATDIHHTYLTRIPAEEISWFYHVSDVCSPERPKLHDEVDCIRLSRKGAFGKTIYFGFCLEACSIDDLELAAGGMVEL